MPATDTGANGGRIITDEEIAVYREKGVVLCRQMVPPALVSAWEQAWQQLSREIAAGSTPISRQDRFVFSHGGLPEPLGTIYRYPTLVASIIKMLGDNVALYM